MKTIHGRSFSSEWTWDYTS